MPAAPSNEVLASLNESERWLQQATLSNQASSSAQRGLGWSHWWQGSPAEAAAAWRAGGFTAQDFANAAKWARQMSQHDQALLWYDRIRLLEPELESTYLYLNYLTLKDLAESEPAALNLEQATSLDSGWLDPAMRFEAWYAWGVLLFQQENWPAAEIALQTAVDGEYEVSDSLRPIQSEAYRYLGLSQWQQADIEPAVANLRQSVYWNEQNAWAHVHFGKLLYIQDPQQLNLTKSEFAYALTLQPEDTTLWQNLLTFWDSMGEDSQTRHLCDQAKEQFGPGSEVTCP